MRTTFNVKSHTSKDCLYEDCLVVIDDIPYKITRCTICGRVRGVVYSNMENSKFIDKHKDLKMFVLQ